MAVELIVEDGSMPDGANTFIELAWADQYLLSRGVQAWADASEDAKTVAIVRAADVLNSYLWRGKPADPSRFMAWPRIEMVTEDGWQVPENSVPVQIMFAQSELAGEIVSSGGDPLAAVDTGKGAVVMERVDVVQVQYSDPSTNAYTGKTGYPAVDGYLTRFLRRNGKFGVVEIMRG